MDNVGLGAVAASVKLGRRVTFEAHGSSMMPLIKNNEIVTVRPILVPPEKGDIVLARVNNHWYLHLVSGLRKGQVQISNNHGHVNGWTSLKNVVGILER